MKGRCNVCGEACDNPILESYHSTASDFTIWIYCSEECMNKMRNR